MVLLIRDDIEVIQRLNQLFETYQSQVEDDFGGKIDRVRMLGVRHGSDGIKNEHNNLGILSAMAIALIAMIVAYDRYNEYS